MNQVAPDIKKKLQKLDRLEERNIRDVMMVAERVYNTRKSAEEKELKKEKKTTKEPCSNVRGTAGTPPLGVG